MPLSSPSCEWPCHICMMAKAESSSAHAISASKAPEVSKVVCFTTLTPNLNGDQQMRKQWKPTTQHLSENGPPVFVDPAVTAIPRRKLEVKVCLDLKPSVASAAVFPCGCNSPHNFHTRPDSREWRTDMPPRSPHPCHSHVDHAGLSFLGQYDNTSTGKSCFEALCAQASPTVEYSRVASVEQSKDLCRGTASDKAEFEHA